MTVMNLEDLETKLKEVDNLCKYLYSIFPPSFDQVDKKIDQNQRDLANLAEEMLKLKQELYGKPLHELRLEVNSDGKHFISNYDGNKVKHLIGINGKRINNIRNYYKIKVNIPSNSNQPISVWSRPDAYDPKLLTQGIDKIMSALK